jgi:hypothetical protein
MNRRQKSKREPKKYQKPISNFAACYHTRQNKERGKKKKKKKKKKKQKQTAMEIVRLTAA